MNNNGTSNPWTNISGISDGCYEATGRRQTRNKNKKRRFPGLAISNKFGSKVYKKVLQVETTQSTV